jgi:nucleoside-diphosphate-sugar epimerase
MSLLHEALRAGHRPPPPSRAGKARHLLVAGGAGALGAAVLEELLADGTFARVAVLVTQPLNTALRGLAIVAADTLDEPPLHAEDTAVVVFDRERHANGREQAFLRPAPENLPSLAAALRRRGVRRLVVVMPHASAMLPEALKQGLANLDEHAVAALDFEQLVFVRSAQASAGSAASHPLQRVADWVLAQLSLMIPQRDKPVRARKVAHFVAALARALPQAPAGTRVVPPELVWDASQAGDVAALVDDWLHGRATAQPGVKPMRM